MRKRLVSIALALAALPALAVDLVTDAPYGVDLTALLAPLWTNPNAANVVAKTVAPNVTTVMNATSITVSGIPYVAPVTFIGSKTVGNGTTTLDTWNGTSGTYKARFRRDGVRLTGEINMLDGNGQPLLIWVVRFNTQGHGAYVILKPPAARTSLIGLEIPNGDGTP